MNERSDEHAEALTLWQGASSGEKSNGDRTCGRMFPEAGSPVFGHRTHEIGFAAFASYADSDDLYLKMDWGGTGSRGLRISVAPDGSLLTRQQLWIS